MPSQHTGSQSIMGKTVSGVNLQTSYWVSHSCTDPSKGFAFLSRWTD